MPTAVDRVFVKYRRRGPQRGSMSMPRSCLIDNLFYSRVVPYETYHHYIDQLRRKRDKNFQMHFSMLIPVSAGRWITLRRWRWPTHHWSVTQERMSQFLAFCVLYERTQNSLSSTQNNFEDGTSVFSSWSHSLHFLHASTHPRSSTHSSPHILATLCSPFPHPTSFCSVVVHFSLHSSSQFPFGSIFGCVWF